MWREILFSIISKTFKYNRTPVEIRILAIALFLQGLGIRRIAKIVNRSKTSVHYWSVKFRESLSMQQ